MTVVCENANYMFDEMLSPISVSDSLIPAANKSLRTRKRKLADCALVVEQSWWDWEHLDFAELKHSSISFFHNRKHETAISRWSRAKTRAARVGKGLSQNPKARKLALRHWLEAIDPLHRYGDNLHFYYVKWLKSQTKEPFFYWLDIGEGKGINLIKKCPRKKLQQQCIKYLGPIERQAYEVVVENGKLLYKQTGEFLDTTKGSRWIFVLSTSQTLYVGKKKKGSFQHSSFLAGGATVAAGRIVTENGVLKAAWPNSGHYRPTPENFQDFVSFLIENNVDPAGVKLHCIDEEEDDLRSNVFEAEMVEKDRCVRDINVIGSNSVKIMPKDEKPAAKFTRKLSALEIPSEDNLLVKLMSESQSSIEGFCPDECISKRINSQKETESFQFGKHLSTKWSTGAGPRIGCIRDFPPLLQNNALEQVNLSSRSKKRVRLESPGGRAESTRTSSNLSCRSRHHCAVQLSSVKGLVL